MKRLIWANLLHLYQPPGWSRAIIARVARQAYRPLVRLLRARPKAHLTINLTGSLTEQLAALGFRDVLEGFAALARRGQIEFTGTAMYHPILPKIPTRIAVRQIRRNEETNRRHLGAVYKPRGFFPPEMCYAHTVGRTVKRLGYHWIALDEIAGRGRLGTLRFDRRWQISGTNGLTAVFRNRRASDIFFLGSVGTPREFVSATGNSLKPGEPLITAMDGEIFGHHKPGMDRLLGKLLDSPALVPVTVSELLWRVRRTATIAARASSWSSQEPEIKSKNPYNLWANPANPIHRLQWQLVRLTLGAARGHGSPEVTETLDRALASDQFWWASAEPWWHRPNILRFARDLVAIVRTAGGPVRAARWLEERISTLARRWETNGEVERRKRIYLARYERIGYFGGKRVS